MKLQHLNYAYNIDNPIEGLAWKDVHLFKEATLPRAHNPALSPIIESVIAKMTEKSTTNRFKSWTEIDEYLSNIDEKNHHIQN